MMYELKIWNYDDAEVRTVEINGEPSLKFNNKSLSSLKQLRYHSSTSAERNYNG